MRNTRYYRGLGLITTGSDSEYVDFGGGPIVNPTDTPPDPGTFDGAGGSIYPPEPVYPVQPVFPIDPVDYPAPAEEIPANTAPIAPGSQGRNETMLWVVLAALIVGYVASNDDN